MNIHQQFDEFPELRRAVREGGVTHDEAILTLIMEHGLDWLEAELQVQQWKQ